MKKKISLTTKPNTSLTNKTGTWRTHRPVTDYNICVGCSLCAKICPEGCIARQEISSSQNFSPNSSPKPRSKLKPITSYNYCKGCGLCAQECPVKAIKMEKDY